MTPVEVVAFSVVWIALLALAALVLLLYRQVEKAYRRSTGVSHEGLPVGAVAPEIGIVLDGSIQALELPASEPALLAFVSNNCDACRGLMRMLDDGTSLATFALVTGDGMREYLNPRNPRLQVHWVASPGDIHEQYRVNLVPTLCVVQDGHVLGSSTDGSPEGLRQLLADSGVGEAAVSAPVGTNGDGALPLVRSDGP